MNDIEMSLCVRLYTSLSLVCHISGLIQVSATFHYRRQHWLFISQTRAAKEINNVVASEIVFL